MAIDAVMEQRKELENKDGTNGNYNTNNFVDMSNPQVIQSVLASRRKR